MEGDLTLSSAPLADLCRLLGIATTQLANVEAADALAYTFPVASADAAQLDLEHVRAFVDHYGDLARVEIRTGDLTEIVLEPGVTDTAIATFTASAPSGGPYDAIITVGKERLAQRLAGPQPVRTVRVFLFAEALRRALTRGITRFESEVWPDAPAPLVIAVLDTEVSLVGAHLSVLGRATSDEIAAAAAEPLPTLNFEAIAEARDRHIGWDTQWVRALTPWHFDVVGTTADAELLKLLRAQLVKLAILFTCDRARSRPAPTPPGEILAEYRGREHVAVVPIDERLPLDGSDAEIAAVKRAVDWCYQRHGTQGQPDWVSDRLPFIQTRVAQALEPYRADERLAVFTRAMPYLFEGIEWHWKAFIEGKVSEYLDRVQQVETIVSDTVTAFADRTAALAKGLTETMLAAVAVLIGSFIAAAFATPFNATLFRIGVLTYAGYVILFPGAVGLLSSASNLRGARAEFDTRIKVFNETLFPEKVTEIIGTRVSDAQRSYYRWLGFVAVAYLAVVIAAGVAAAKIPSLVTHKPASSALTFLQFADERRVTYSTRPIHCQVVSGPHPDLSRPDHRCTPGSVDPRVTQPSIETTICQSGWTDAVRPPPSQTKKAKAYLYKAYDISPQKSELDHLIPLQLGGSNDITNLWIEVGPIPNARPRPRKWCMRPPHPSSSMSLHESPGPGRKRASRKPVEPRS